MSDGRGAARPAKDIVVTVHGRSGRKHFSETALRPRLISLASYAPSQLTLSREEMPK